MGQTVNLLAHAYGGSNPSSPTTKSQNRFSNPKTHRKFICKVAFLSLKSFPKGKKAFRCKAPRGSGNGSPTERRPSPKAGEASCEGGNGSASDSELIHPRQAAMDQQGCKATELIHPPERGQEHCGSSSVDRASAFQAEGREFEPRLPLEKIIAENSAMIFEEEDDGHRRRPARRPKAGAEKAD